MEISERIKAARKAAGLTQRELAEKARISKNAVQQYELGIRYPKAEFLVKIAGALGITVDSLLFPAGDAPEASSEGIIPEAPSQDPYLDAITEALQLLNVRGRRVAVERIRELTEIQKYRASAGDSQEE